MQSVKGCIFLFIFFIYICIMENTQLDYRINDRAFRVKILQNERQKTIVKNQPRIIQICWTVQNNKRVTGEKYYPLEWLNKSGEVKKEIKEKIAELTRDFSRVYKYVTNTSVDFVKEIDASDDEGLLEIICLYESNLVAVPYLNKNPKRSLLVLENEKLTLQNEMKKFDIEFEVNKELYGIKDDDESMDTYIVLLGYNPQLFRSREEKLLWLLKREKAEMFDIIQDTYENKVLKAIINILLQVSAIKKNTNGYFYNETFLGYSYNELMNWFRNPKNNHIVNHLRSYIPKERMYLIKDKFIDGQYNEKLVSIENIDEKSVL